MATDPFKKAQKQADASDGYAAYRAQDAAKIANMLRLREERLAREGATPPEPKPVAAESKKRKRIIRK